MGGFATRTVLLVLALLNLAALLSVFLRRTLKNRFFALKDERRLVWSEVVDAVFSGEPVPSPAPSLRYRWDREAAEEVLLERVVTATPEQSAKLQSLFRRWRLFEGRIRRLLWGTTWQQARSALVLAKMQCRETYPAIVTLLDSPNSDVRLAAVNALGIIGHPEALPPLLGILPGSSGREVRAVLAAVLRCAQSTPERLVPYLQHSAFLVRLVVAAALAELARKDEVSALLQAVADPEGEVRAKVARALGQTGDPAALTGLQTLVGDSVWFVRLQAVAGLSKIGHRATEPALWQAAQDADGRVRKKAAIALHHLLRDPAGLLARLRQQPGDGIALAGLVDELARHGVTWQAINRICSPLPMAREESQGLIRELLRAGFFAATLYAVEAHPDPPVRRELLGLVEECAGPAVRPHLAALLESPALDADSRRRVEGLLARPEAQA